MSNEYKGWNSVKEFLPPKVRTVILFSNGVVQESLWRIEYCEMSPGIGYWVSDHVDISGERFMVKDSDMWRYLPDAPE